MRMTKQLDLDAVRKELAYCPATGVFTRLKTHRAVKAGDVAGTREESTQSPGKFYIRLSVLGVYVWAHRLAWALTHNRWPALDVDHIDQDSENNKASNLREASKQANSMNLGKYRNNTLGHSGITLRPNGKFRARIMREGRSYSLGDWDSLEAAVVARNRAKVHHGFHPNHS